MPKNYAALEAELNKLGAGWRRTSAQAPADVPSIDNLVARGHLQGVSDTLRIAAEEVDKLLAEPNGEVILKNRIPRESYQVGDRVNFLGFGEPVLGTITGVHLQRGDDDFDLSEMRTHDIQLDDGELLLAVWNHIERAPQPPRK